MSSRSPAKRHGSKQVTELLKSGSSGLGKLLQQARKLQSLDRKLATILEPGISSQVRVASLIEQRLVLITPSAALATRLRQDSESILSALRASGARNISHIQVRTAPLPGVENNPRKKRGLPAAARESLEQFAKDSGDEDE